MGQDGQNLDKAIGQKAAMFLIQNEDDLRKRFLAAYRNPIPNWPGLRWARGLLERRAWGKERLEIVGRVAFYVEGYQDAINQVNTRITQALSDRDGSGAN